MEVLSADGICLGRVRDASRPGHIKLASQSKLGGDEIESDWIAWVDGSVFLKKTKDQILSAWRNADTFRLDAAA